MVLEPVFSPRAGLVLNVLMAVAIAAVAIVIQTPVASVEGNAPLTFLGALLAMGFVCRAVGLAVAVSRRQWSMDWFSRVLSWIFLGAASVSVAIIGAARVMFVFGAFVAVDAAAAFVKREVKEPARPARNVDWKRVVLVGVLALYLAGVVAFHLLVAKYLPYGTLVTWSLLSLAFVVVLRMMLVGEKADEAWLHAPSDHRLHERVEERVPDPQREKAEAVLQALYARGDASGLLEFVRTAGSDAGLAEADITALEQRILASLARAGTRRQHDVETALAEVERFLSPRKEIRPS